LKKIPIGVSRAIDSYWRTGIVSGLIILDCFVICVCFVDAVRFMYHGLSYTTAIRVAFESALDGNFVWSAVAVLAFFLVGLPMGSALLSSMVAPLERWPKLLRSQKKSTLLMHTLLSSLIALLTMVAAGMEVLSGWQKTKVIGYSFVSIWLAVVLMGQPVYVFYISPIIKKFFMRVSAAHDTKIKDVIEEVVSEENLGA
jgi:hypothetical protein